MNKTEKGVTMIKQNKTEKINAIHFLINNGLLSGEWGWLCCKWKKAYDCLNICCNYCVCNFKVIAYQIVQHNCAQIISLIQMI